MVNIVTTIKLYMSKGIVWELHLDKAVTEKKKTDKTFPIATCFKVSMREYLSPEVQKTMASGASVELFLHVPS